ncbi:MAG: regulatory protein GemA [Rhizobiales bacterium]|nr:regulatory protein GemA [Hyphomicrobiales bacterium]
MTNRNALIAKIHIAKKQTKMDDGAYRFLLERVTGKNSCTKLSDDQLAVVVEEFKSKGFIPKKSANKKFFKASNKAYVRKIYRQWTVLEGLGAVRVPGRPGLFKFISQQLPATRNTNITKPADMLEGHEAMPIIEALKAWIKRAKKEKTA